jgi:CHAT domain-containing protein
LRTAKTASVLLLSLTLCSSGAAYGQGFGGGNTFPQGPGQAAIPGTANLAGARPLPPVEGAPVHLPDAVSGGWQDVYETKIDPNKPLPTDIVVPPGMEGHLRKGVNPVQQIPNFDIPQSAETLDKVQKKEADGENFFAQQLYDKALECWQECYALSKEMKWSPGEGRALTNMCRIYLERGQFVKAKYMGENAVEVLADMNDKKSLGHARLELARAYYGLHNDDWAASQLEEALRLFTTGGTANSKEAADTMTFAAGLMIRVKNYKPALQMYEAAATYYEQSGAIPDAVRIRVSIASMMDEFGLYIAANDEAQKAVSLARGLKDKQSYVAAMSSAAMAQYELCEYANARRTYEETLRMASTLTIKQLSAVARAYIDVGYGCTLAANGDLELAKPVLIRTLPSLKAGGAMACEAQTLNVLATIDALQGSYATAISMYDQSLDLQNLVQPRQHKLQVVTLQNVAAALSRSGNNREAKQRLEMTLPVLKHFHSQLLEARTYSGLGEVTLKLMDPAKAEEYTRTAIEIGEKTNDDASLWRDYTILAKIQMTAGNESEAKNSLQSALSHFRSPQAGAFPNPERLDYPSTLEDMGEQLVALSAKAGFGEQALLTAEQLKEESFSNEWHRRGGQVRADDRDAYTELATLRAHLHAAEAADNPGTMLKDWQNWLSRFSSLAAQNKPLARMVAAVPNTIQDVTKITRSDKTTLLEYLVGADSSVIFTVEQSGRIAATVLPVTRKQLQSQVTALLSASTGREDAAKTKILLQALYNELLPASVRNFLPKNPDQVVAVIPDGVLFNLPFAALMDPQGHYLVEQHTLTLASSASVFMDSPPKYAEQSGVVIAASPTAFNEANMISSALGPNQVTLASKDAATMQEQARGKATVQVATASSAPINNPMATLIPLSEKDGGKVTANRLFGLSLANDLVVLSGTAVNAADTQGTAVKVISRGLNYAGARNVLMSLWLETDQERASELVEFYRNKANGLSQAQSLRRAQMLALSRDPSPRSWAAFQLLGPGF